jgi:transglutaminase-like putative cysteine protease
MNRRDFLRSAGGAAAAALPGASRALAQSGRAADGWGSFEVATSVEVMKPAGTTRVWLPMPLISDTPYQKSLGNTFHAEGGKTSVKNDAASATGILAAEWPEGVRPVLTMTSRVSTRNYTADLSKPAPSGSTDQSAVARFLKPSALIPTDGIVEATAAEIVGGARTDVDKARAIYDWIVDNTFRDPAVKGCGKGDIRFMLETKNLGGKCADLNALYVGLARAAGLPARDVYGIRVAKSERGFKSLGASSENVTKSQHCRAEVYLGGYGWVPVDPADVRKVVLEEPPGHRSLDDELVRQARARLFGSWEMNWMAYNYSHDVELPDSSGPKIGFLMYPQCETANGRLDSLDADNFRYQITARQVT